MFKTRDAIGREIRLLRKAQGVTGADLAARMGCTQSLISKIENGHLRPDPSWVAKLCKKLALRDGEAKRLSSMTSQFLFEFDRWGTNKATTIQQLQQQYKEREEAAAIIQAFESSLIHGLLQTEAYAKAVFESYLRVNPIAASNDVLEAIRIRSKRQQQLLSKQRRVTIIQSEASIATCFPTRQIHCQQLERIKEMIREGVIEIRILPLSETLDVIPVTSFAMFDENVVEMETATSSIRSWEPSDIGLYRELFKSVLIRSVAGTKAISILTRAMHIRP